MGVSYEQRCEIAAKVRDVLAECCDVIQATCNLVAALGISDLRKEMRLCRKRNEMRGRSYGA